MAAEILAPGRPLAFVHPIVRAGIYADVGSAERARAHRAAARLLADAHAPGEQVVEHLLASEPAADAWVAERLVAAARGAARTGAPELAAVYLRRALAEPAPEDERSALLLELGVAEDNAGETGALGHMEEAVAAAATPDERLGSALVLGHALARDNRFAEAVEVLDGAAAAPEPADERLARAAEALAASTATFSPATAQAHAARIRAARAVADADAGASHEQLALAGQLAVRAGEPAEVAAGLALRALAAARGALPAPTDLPWFHQCAITLLWASATPSCRACSTTRRQRPRARRRRALLGRARVPELAVAAARRPARRRGRRPHRDRGGQPAGAADVPDARHRGARAGAHRARAVRRGRRGVAPVEEPSRATPTSPRSCGSAAAGCGSRSGATRRRSPICCGRARRRTRRGS